MDSVDFLMLGGGLAVGAACGWGIYYLREKRRQERLQQDASSIIRDAERSARELKDKTEDELHKTKLDARQDLDKEVDSRRGELRKSERTLEKRESQLDRQEEKVQGKSRKLDEEKERVQVKEKKLEDTQKEVDDSLTKQRSRLLEIAELNPQEAKDIVLERFERECASDLAKFIKKNEEVKKEHAEEISQRILASTIQRCAVQYTCEAVTSAIDLPSDDMKGRIIGREGRNIRAIEKATGVDVIVDDTPGVIIISCFDAVRREIARKAMERLIQDGRIHPARVEDLVATTRKEIENDIKSAGRKTVKDLKLARVHPQLQYLVGRLKFRSSYGQNVLDHSIEVAYILAMIAAELKLDPVVARRCGIMHDMGKSLTHEVEGSHAIIGYEQAKRYDEKHLVCNAIGAHHEEMPYESPYAVLTQVADAISAGRPGARRDSIERYIERLEKLEKTATSFDGVQSAFALQAGRELRVMADADKMSDDEALVIASKIARKIEEELTYPGEIKVTLIRERRVTEVAH